MDDESIFVVFIIIPIVCLCLFLAYIFVQDSNDEAALEKFVTEKHICSECGWTGNAGECKHIGGYDSHEYYYCPECGKILGEFN